MLRKITLLLALFTLICCPKGRASEHAFALTDKDLYFTGERLHVSVCITDSLLIPSALSRVAYVEVSDTYHLCLQAMVALVDGRGWADISLPSTLHSGNYLLSVYTRAMRNGDLTHDSSLFTKVISVVNPSRLFRADDIAVLPADSLATLAPTTSFEQLEATPNATVSIPLPEGHPLLRTASLYPTDVVAPSYEGFSPQLRQLSTPTSSTRFLPEYEGHIVISRPSSEASVVEHTRLVMIGKEATLYDGQWQPDGTWHYYTIGLYGRRPVFLSTVSPEGEEVTMEFVSPYAKLVPQTLPQLKVCADEAQFRQRAQSALLEQAVSEWQGQQIGQQDSLNYSSVLLSAKPRYSYDLDEYTRFSSVREILIEFVRGVKHDKVSGVDQLFVLDSEMHEYSSWSALVLLDGMPVFNISDILNYDARLLQYVNIYTDRYIFGSQIYGGIISFTSRKGQLSNFSLRSGMKLAIYNFPQLCPAFVAPREAKAGTLYWNPAVGTSDHEIIAPETPGHYRLVVQQVDPTGVCHVRCFELVVEAK